MTSAGEEILPEGYERFVSPVLAEGRTGFVFFPSRHTGGETVEVYDPSGYTVHLTPVDAPGEELVHRAGVPFLPPAGTWRVWLQGEWAMTPSAQRMTLRSGMRPATSPKLVPVAPAGRVRAAEVLADDPDLDLWVLAAWWRPTMRFGGYALSRRRPVAETDEGILMPAGPVLPALWDRREERYVAVGRPVDVRAGQTVSAAFEPPSPESAHLILFGALPPDVPPPELTGFEPVAVQGESERRPDLVVPVAEGAYAVWYDLAAVPTRVDGGNGRLYAEPVTLELAGGEVHRAETALLERPTLTVHLILPPRLRKKPLRLSVRALPDGGEMFDEQIDRSTRTHRVTGLIQATVEVVLGTHLGDFRRQVDLTAELDAAVTLEPELIEVHGAVERGGEPHPATVTFQTVTGDPVTAETDDDGQYRAVSVHSLRWVDVALRGSEQEPWRDILMPAIAASRELDFDLSAAEVVVRVVDAATGEGLDGASVDARIEYLQPPGPDDDERPAEARRRAIGRSFPTGADGAVHLPPLRPGRLELTASAEGYRSSADSLVLEIDESTRRVDRQIALEALGATVTVRLSLPDGAPAAGAEVLRLDPTGRPGADFYATAGPDGVVEVPVEPRAGLLLLRHPAAASAAVDWEEIDPDRPWAWTFRPRAAVPLTVRVLEPSGDQPAGGARVAIWVDGRKVPDQLARWLYEARLIADPNGFWTAQGLPAGPVRVLAWSRQLEDEAASGALDSLATEVPYPWPARVEVRGVR